MPRHDIIQSCDDVMAAFTPEVTADEALAAIELVARLKEIARELSQQCEARAIAWVEKNGDLYAGEKRYYVAPNTSTKCKSVRGTLESLLKATNGDFDAVVACLSSDCFKHGACRDILPGDEYADLFETKQTNDLKTGKPSPRRLQTFDPNVLKGKLRGAPKRTSAGTDGPAD